VWERGRGGFFFGLDWFGVYTALGDGEGRTVVGFLPLHSRHRIALVHHSALVGGGKWGGTERGKNGKVGENRGKGYVGR
jgi:hypothetical protein